MKIIVDNGGSKSDWLILPSNEIFSFDGINFFKNPQELNNEFKKIINHLNIGKEKVILDEKLAFVKKLGILLYSTLSVESHRAPAAEAKEVSREWPADRPI